MSLVNTNPRTKANALRQICKSDKAYDICLGSLQELGVCDEEGLYLLSERKKSALFACLETIYVEYRGLLKRPMSKRELLIHFSRFLNIEVPGRLSRDSKSFEENEAYAKQYIAAEKSKLVNNRT